MGQHERDSERIFSDPVFEAELPDVEFAGAFLLGLDLRAIATEADVPLVEAFVKKMTISEETTGGPLSIDEDWSARDASYFHQQLSAFWKGFTKQG